MASEWAKKNNKDEAAFYSTPMVEEYLALYASFIRKYQASIDYYANVDAIGHPEVSYKNQLILENKHGLKPVPVIHKGADMKWIKLYIDKGYDFIALGGLAGKAKTHTAKNWLNTAFDVICDQPSKLPKVKVHGFGITTVTTMLKYPWWSVDSTTWTKDGGFGTIIIPRKRGGKYIHNVKPHIIRVAIDSPNSHVHGAGRHYFTMTREERHFVHEWCELVNVPVGKMAPNKKDIIEYGVINRHIERRAINLRFYEWFRAQLPDWPWPYHQPKTKGFNLLA